MSASGLRDNSRLTFSQISSWYPKSATMLLVLNLTDLACIIGLLSYHQRINVAGYVLAPMLLNRACELISYGCSYGRLPSFFAIAQVPLAVILLAVDAAFSFCKQESCLVFALDLSLLAFEVITVFAMKWIDVVLHRASLQQQRDYETAIEAARTEGRQSHGIVAPPWWMQSRADAPAFEPPPLMSADAQAPNGLPYTEGGDGYAAGGSAGLLRPYGGWLLGPADGKPAPLPLPGGFTAVVMPDGVAVIAHRDMIDPRLPGPGDCIDAGITMLAAGADPTRLNRGGLLSGDPRIAAGVTAPGEPDPDV